MNHNKINENNSEENVPKSAEENFYTMGNSATGIVLLGGLE